ncbi:MAG TPA: UdgX family uracil-DNA binding protein [Actinomycetes bacterium]|nr:UdgX family uracil-DNA binding protein [Actinomycetes bacterium]
MADPERPGAARWVPAGAGIDQLAAAARDCEGCELYKDAIQTVFSKGSPTARVVFVGEQPGDQEDQQGAPFVGPAGRLLDRALEQVGIAPADSYVTNAVKHFRFQRATHGKRRIHQTPDMVHIEACRPWLDAEMAVLDPEVLVILGATAGRALLGPSFRVTQQRGLAIPMPPRDGEDAARKAGFMVPTVHPSAVLRADDQDQAFEAFVKDLRVAADLLS